MAAIEVRNGALYIDPDQLDWVYVENGALYIDPDASRGSAYIVDGASGTLYVTESLFAVSPAGIPSTEAAGAPDLKEGTLLSPSGIPSAGTVAAPVLEAGSARLAPTGIASGEAVGVPALTMVMFPAGAPSGELHGRPAISTGAVMLSVEGVSPGEAFGVSQILPGAVPLSVAAGIAGEESVGTPALTMIILPSGVSSAEAFGAPGFSVSGATVYVQSIPYGGAVTDPVVLPAGAVQAIPAGIPSVERFGRVYVFDPAQRALATAAQRRVGLAATLAGKRGPIQVRHRMFLSNIRGEDVRELPGWDSADVDCNNNRESAWGLTLEMPYADLLDPYKDYVLAAVDVYSEGWQRFPMGLYRFTFPGSEYLEAMHFWSLGGESPESLLAGDNPRVAEYAVTKGTGALAAVRRILNQQGVPDAAIRFPPPDEDRPLVSTMAFSGNSESEGSDWLSICNKILAAVGFLRLQCDNYGRYTTTRTKTVAEREPAVHYTEANASRLLGEGAEPMLVGDPTEEPTDERFANVVIVRSEDVEQEPPSFAIAENNDPDSPGSIQNVRRRVVKEIRYQSISQEAAASLAKYHLEQATSYFRKITIQTLLDPRRTVREDYEVDVFSGSGFPVFRAPGEVAPAGVEARAISGRRRVVQGRWSVNSWGFSMSDEPSSMSHEVTKVASLKG